MILLVAAAAILGISAFFSIKMACLVCLAAAMLMYRSSAPKALLFITLILLFFLNSHLHAYFNRTELTGEENLHIIRFTDVPSVKGSLVQTIVKTPNGEKLLLKYYLNSEKEKAAFESQFRLGLVCKASGTLEKPTANRNPEAFNYQKYLYSQNVYWILKSDASPIQNCKIDRMTLFERIKAIRLSGLRKIDTTYPPESKGFAAALLFGDTSAIEESVYDAYKDLSLIHILAISGLHVAAISGALMYALIRIGITREKAKQILIFLMPIYAILAGGAPSVLRACVMVMIFLVLSLFKIRCSTVDVLAAVFSLLLFINPFYLQNSGFQLSFFITFSLLMSRNILAGTQTAGPLFQSLTVTVICQLCSIPIILFHFHQFSLWGFLMNILYIPLFTVCLLPLTILSFVLALLNFPLHKSLIGMMESLFKWSSDAAEWVSRLPLTSLSFAKPSLLLALLLFTCIFYLLYSWDIRKQGHIIRSILLCFGLLLFQYNKQLISPYGEIIFIDVGQGDSILIKQPFGGGVYLIDTGGILRYEVEGWKEKSSTFEPGQHIVVPFLQSKGIRSIDKLILTHDDQDHIGGAAAILKEIDVKEIIIPEALKKEFGGKDIIKEALAEKVPIKLVRAGYAWKERDDDFVVIHPDVHKGDSNESSLVLLARINQMNWLFTGDLGIDGEKEIISRQPNLRIDVLKVGHHGSKTSSSAEFIDSLDVKTAVFSTGENNRYGHPHAEVLQTYEERDIQIFRTDQMGAVSYTYFFGRGTFTAELP